MDNTIKYTKLQELAATIHAKLELLNSGKLSTAELEEMTEQSRELFERLVVLRYMAYDETVNGTKASTTETLVAPEVVAPVQEEVKWESGNQVSLIDAIEEVTKSEKTEETQPMFTFDTTPKQEEAPISNMLFDLAALPATESVNEMLAKTMGSRETLAQSLEHKPITDLKEAITLNQRFQFSRELFKGNNQDYELAIDHLNRVSRDEAMSHLNTLRSKYEWNHEAAVTHDFIVLIERRHQ